MGTAELAQLQTAGVAPATRIDHRCVHGRLSDWYTMLLTVLVVAEHLLEWHLFGLMNAQLCYLGLCVGCLGSPLIIIFSGVGRNSLPPSPPPPR